MAQTSAAKGAAQNKSANGIDPRRQAALDTALAQVEKSFGKGSAMRLGDRPEQDVEVIPTGSLALDMALGIGGLPKGRIVRFMVRNPPARPHWRCMWWPMPRKTVASPRSSMRNMRLTRSMRASSASILIR